MEGRFCSAMPERSYLHTLVEPGRSEEAATYLTLDCLLELNMHTRLDELA